jgi:uncharacterized lipoprotein YmbA
MARSHWVRFVFLISLCFLFAFGCVSSKPSKYYILTPMQKVEKGVEGEAPGQGLAIGIGPIEFPEYLDRSEIVTRTGSNEIEFTDFDLWAGSLQENFGRVLAENLSALLPTDTLVLLPRPRLLPLNYQIAMEVIRFDGALGGDVTLITRWAVFKAKDKKPLFIRKSNVTEPVETKGYEALVAAQSRAVEHLSRQIAEAIKTLPE